MHYLLVKGMARLRNDYVRDEQEWILWCYPGRPYKSQIYLFQQNFFNLDNPKNPYQNAYYDLERKLLYKLDEIDIDSFVYK